MIFDFIGHEYRQNEVRCLCGNQDILYYTYMILTSYKPDKVALFACVSSVSYKHLAVVSTKKRSDNIGGSTDRNSEFKKRKRE